MRVGGGKGKGSNFELEIGYKLSLWLSDNQRKDLICRTVGSGAQFTTAKLKNKKSGHAGDLRSQDPLADELCKQYVIECKHWKNLQLIQFLDGRGDFYKAMTKVKLESLSVGKKWWLIARQNHQKDLLLMERENLVSDSYLVHPQFHSLFSDTVNVYYLDEFLSCIDPKKYLQ